MTSRRHTLTSAAKLDFVLLRGGTVTCGRGDGAPFPIVARDEIGAEFDVWLRALLTLQNRGALELASETPEAVTYRRRTAR